MASPCESRNPLIGLPTPKTVEEWVKQQDIIWANTKRYVYEPPPLPRAAMEADLEADIQAITATLHEGNAISYALLEDRGPDILDVTRDIARGG